MMPVLHALGPDARLDTSVHALVSPQFATAVKLNVGSPAQPQRPFSDVTALAARWDGAAAIAGA